MDCVPQVATHLSHSSKSIFGAVSYCGGKAVKVIPEGLFPIVRLFLLAGVLGTAITIVAMEYFLFGFDNSSALKKVFWFGVMLFPLLGPALYCFIVYSRSDVVEANDAKRVGAASA